MPEVKDSYDNEAEAQIAAAKLQAYTDEYEGKRRPTKRCKRRRAVCLSNYSGLNGKANG